MIIKSENSLSKLEINFVEKEVINYPSLEINCNVNNENFIATSNYWIEKDSFNNFINSLKHN